VLVAPVLIEKGVSAGYGYKHASRSIFYPASPWGDLEVVLAYLSQNEAYKDIAEYLATELVWGFFCQAVVLGLLSVLCSEREGRSSSRRLRSGSRRDDEPRDGPFRSFSV
jgi:hypothetical protein